MYLLTGKLKILIISDDNPFIASTAANNRFVALASGIQEKGAEVELVILNQSFFGRKKRGMPNEGCYHGIKYYHFLKSFVSVFCYRYLYNLYLGTICKNIEKTVNGKTYDYIWIRFSPKTIPIGTKLIDSKTGLKTIHDRNEYSWISLKNKSDLHTLYINSFLPRIDILAVISKSLCRYYQQYVKSDAKIIHLPMTVDFSRFENVNETKKHKKRYIAYCGTLNIKKDGVDILIRSFINIMHMFPDLHLFLVGNYSTKSEYHFFKNLVKKHDATNKVSFLGPISREEIPAFLSEAEILALARPASKQAEGGFPTKLGEYLATGKPVCVTSTGEIEHYLKNNESAFLATPGSVDSFTEALIRALTYKNATTIGEAGKHVALQNFDKSSVSNMFLDFLNRHKYNNFLSRSHNICKA